MKFMINMWMPAAITVTDDAHEVLLQWHQKQMSFCPFSDLKSTS